MDIGAQTQRSQHGRSRPHRISATKMPSKLWDREPRRRRPRGRRRSPRGPAAPVGERPATSFSPSFPLRRASSFSSCFSPEFLLSPFFKVFYTSKESESEKANREKILPAGMFGRLAIKMMVRKKMYASLKKFFPLWAQVSMHRIMQLLVAKITHELRATAMLEHVLFSTCVQPLPNSSNVF